MIRRYRDGDHSDGHVDGTYVDPDFAGNGVMSELLREIKSFAAKNGVASLFAEVSITARPFFERHGFVWERDNTVTVRGVEISNFIMRCALNPSR